MARKVHLQDTRSSVAGPTCQSGKFGWSLRGEHLTVKFADFVTEPAEHQCSRCRSSKLFSFLTRRQQLA